MPKRDQKNQKPIPVSRELTGNYNISDQTINIHHSDVNDLLRGLLEELKSRPIFNSPKNAQRSEFYTFIINDMIASIGKVSTTDKLKANIENKLVRLDDLFNELNKIVPHRQQEINIALGRITKNHGALSADSEQLLVYLEHIAEAIRSDKQTLIQEYNAQSNLDRLIDGDDLESLFPSKE